jgi:hypothetical protein
MGDDLYCAWAGHTAYHVVLYFERLAIPAAAGGGIFYIKHFFFLGGGIFFTYYIQHCVICRPSDSTVLTDAGIEPRTVATGALAVRHSNH